MRRAGQRGRDTRSRSAIAPQCGHSSEAEGIDARPLAMTAGGAVDAVTDAVSETAQCASLTAREASSLPRMGDPALIELVISGEACAG